MKIPFKIKVVLLLIFVVAACSKKENTDFENHKHEVPNTTDEDVILPPAWAFGILYGSYTNQDQSIELINEIIDHDYPIDAFWIDSWIWDWENQGKGPKKYMDFIADTVSYYDMEEMWSFMERKNIKAGMWMWDAIQITGNEEAYEDFKSRDFFKEEVIHRSSWHNGSRTTIMDDQSNQVKGTMMGNIDFENPEAVKYFKQRVKHFFDKGVDFVKLDKTDNIHVVKAMFELSQELGKETEGRGFVFSHSGGVESNEYKKYPAKWTDDTRSDWTVENPQRSFSSWIPKVALKENLEMYTDTSKHFHEIPFLANDMGGFAINVEKYVDEELYIRWSQMANWLPITTPFSQPENQTGNIAFKVSDKADQIFRNYAQHKMELFPFLYSYAHLSRWEGVNAVRSINGKLHEFMLGEEFFVAPVIEPGVVQRKIDLPKGNWINYWTGEAVNGGKSITVETNLEHIPVFVRQGSIVPLRNYARSIELGSNDTLQLKVYLGESRSFTLYEDDGISNDYLEGIYLKTKFELTDSENEAILNINPAKGNYKGLKKKRVYNLSIHSNRPINSIKIGDKSYQVKSIEGSIYQVDNIESNKFDGLKISINKIKG
ncbi:DUF5110 domain-containing protein [Belliella sp. R4-6]|uniref:DUF5110 domain-containing protein n=1 Tax=Belliella alkalica TaxID=1730871 RepID=A0ABS9V7B7_9BACT|nr:TIM-barrel domain-containing protein [Belliella alkalica]MCH7412309.1 DUF5110 domain-containing protein [Belliella alkalica]